MENEAVKGDSVEVLWIDTHTPSVSGWMSVKQYDEFRTSLVAMRNVGIFYAKDDDYLHLVGCQDMDGDEITLPMSIPIGCIKKVRVLK